jgi:hypothetical protein
MEGAACSRRVERATGCQLARLLFQIMGSSTPMRSPKKKMSTSRTSTTILKVHMHKFRLHVQGEGLIGRPRHAGMLEGSDPQEALDGFKQVVEMEGDKGEW